MQATEIVDEPQTVVRMQEQGIREMEDVLSRYLPRFYKSA
jgi:hypothetical protein